VGLERNHALTFSKTLFFPTRVLASFVFVKISHVLQEIFPDVLVLAVITSYLSIFVGTYLFSEFTQIFKKEELKYVLTVRNFALKRPI
jgi:hypothetical protein